jgi:hypothetical protein
MATVTPTVTDISKDGTVIMITWALTSANADGAPAEWCSFADRTATFTGTWGGATAALEGSNDGTNWLPLADVQGTAITATSNKIEMAVELTRFVRPNLTTAGSGAAVSATLLMRRN